MLPVASERLPAAETNQVSPLSWRSAPRQFHCELSTTSSPVFGIGNGTPPLWPVTDSAATLAWVALYRVLSRKNCGAAKVRCEGYTSMRKPG